MEVTMRRVIVLVTCVGLLAGCGENGSNEQFGSLIGGGSGAALGGVLGNVLGRGKNSGIATAFGVSAGALAGALIGGAIGRNLDARDRQTASHATVTALQTGTSRSWKSDHSGVSGKTVVLKTTKDTAGEECRNVRETAYIQGKQVEQDAKYCRNHDGEWVTA